jgi:hypothetical protein
MMMMIKWLTKLLIFDFFKWTIIIRTAAVDQREKKKGKMCGNWFIAYGMICVNLCQLLTKPCLLYRRKRGIDLRFLLFSSSSSIKTWTNCFRSKKATLSSKHRLSMHVTTNFIVVELIELSKLRTLKCRI